MVKVRKEEDERVEWRGDAVWSIGVSVDDGLKAPRGSSAFEILFAGWARERKGEEKKREGGAWSRKYKSSLF